MKWLLWLWLFPFSLVAQTPRLQLETIATGLYRPTDMVAISTTEFLVGQTNGIVQLVRNGAVQSTPFLDISSLISNTLFEGIFGITIHPKFDQNGYVYVHYSRKNDLYSVIVRYTRKTANPD